MSKTAKPFVKRRSDANGNMISKKATSHGFYRCKRKPNSKVCTAGHPNA